MRVIFLNWFILFFLEKSRDLTAPSSLPGSGKSDIRFYRLFCGIRGSMNRLGCGLYLADKMVKILQKFNENIKERDSDQQTDESEKMFTHQEDNKGDKNREFHI